MQTYWDAATKRWVTKLPDGTVRAATNSEALLAVSNGAQAPAGTPGPGATSPTPALNPVEAHPLQRGQQTSIVIGGTTYTWDASTGQYRDPQGHTTADNNAPQTPTTPATGPGTSPVVPPDQPAPYPALDMSWRNNDQYSVYGRLHGDGSYFQGTGGQPLTTSQQLFYQTGEGQHPAYQQFMAGEADPNSYYSRWLGSQEGRVENGFKNASVADPNLQRTYYYDQQSKGLNSMFANLPGWQQGYNAPGGFAGRRM